MIDPRGRRTIGSWGGVGWGVRLEAAAVFLCLYNMVKYKLDFRGSLFCQSVKCDGLVCVGGFVCVCVCVCVYVC